MKKQAISILLTVCMVLGMMPTVAFAAENGEDEPVACTCISKCAEGEVNGNCPVCSEDYSACAFIEETSEQDKGPTTCVCTEKCEEGTVNENCPICSADYTACLGEAESTPATYSIAEGDSLYVNGVNILEDSDHLVTCGDGTAVFDLDTGILTLDNATITSGGGSWVGIKMDTTSSNATALQIKLEGANTITGSADNKILYGLFNQFGAITITGADAAKDSLTINTYVASNSDTSAGMVAGIDTSRNLSITDAKIVYDNIGFQTTHCNGICEAKKIELTNSELEFSHCTVSIRNSTNAEPLNITDSKVTFKEMRFNSSYPYMLYGGAAVNISGSTITIDGCEGYGIYASDKLTISDESDITVNCSTTYYGIYGVKNIDIDHSRVLSTANGYGIYTPMDLTIRNKSNVTSKSLANFYGIQGKNINIDDSYVVSSSNSGMGTYAVGAMTLDHDSTLKSTVDTSVTKQGLYIKTDLSVKNNSTVQAASADGNAIYVIGGITAESGSTVEATSTSGLGIWVVGSLTSTDSEVKATSDSSWGLYVGANAEINNSTIRAVTSQTNQGFSVTGNLTIEASDVTAKGANKGIYVGGTFTVAPPSSGLVEVKTAATEAEAAHVVGSPFSETTSLKGFTFGNYYRSKSHVHTGGVATCIAKAVCGDCGFEYGEFDADNHDGGTEVRGAIPATSTQAGYTGDTYCLGCGNKIADGTATAIARIAAVTQADWVYHASKPNPVVKVSAGSDQTPTIYYYKDNSGSIGEQVDSIATADAGTYWIKASYEALSDPNPVCTAVEATAQFKILKAPVTFTVSDNLKEATGSPIEVSISADVLGSTQYNITYRQGEETVMQPIAVGTYDIYAAITDNNYRHTAKSNGAALKIGELTIYEQAPTTYAVTFSGGDGTGESPVHDNAASGATFLLPANPYRYDGYSFAGWLCGGITYQPGDTFTMPASAVTITAKWSENTYTVGGVVNQDGEPVAQATVTLMLGAKQIATTVTDSEGKYSFNQVVPGTYNLVATSGGITETTKVDVVNKDQTQNLVLPAGKTNSIVEVKEDTPDIVVGGIEQVFKQTDEVYTDENKTTVDNGGSVEIKMTVEQKEETAVRDDAAKILAATSENSEEVSLYLDISVIKTVTDQFGTTAEPTVVPVLNTLAEIIIPLPAELQGKEGYKIYRVHGSEAEATPITTTANDDGEKIVVNEDKTVLTLYAKKYSTYAIAYTANHYQISFNANGGSVTPATATTNADGTLTSLPTPTKSGSYSFNGWYTAASGGTKIDLAHVFTGDVTIYAQWSYTGGGSGGGSGSVATTVKVSDTTNGKVTANTTTASKGSKVTITVAPSSGYSLKSFSITDKNGNQVTYIDNSNGTYTFTVPDATPVTVTATFTKTVADPADTGVSATLQTVEHIKYIGGYANGTVGPERNMTRGEVAQMFYNLLLNKDVTITKSFPDVPDTMWCAKAVNTLTSLGVISGYTNGEYGPNDAITREQFCAIAVHFATKIQADSMDYSVSFGDVPTSTWSYDSVMTAASLGWIGGYGNGTFGPKDHITRAQVMTIVNHMLGRSADKNFVDGAANIKSFTDLSNSHWAYYDIMEATNAHDYAKNGSVETWSSLE